MPEQLRATPMQNVLQIAAGFKPASPTRVAEIPETIPETILETWTALGPPRQIDDRYSL